MNVLLLGSGGREHALAWKLSQSPLLTTLFCAPGNGGTRQLATHVGINPEDPAAVVAFCQGHGVELVVVGPEAPLVAGVADACQEAGIFCVGPVQGSARLEASKTFGKNFMKRYDIPTASAYAFTVAQYLFAKDTLRQIQPPYVIKADGLAAGKGVVITSSYEEAVQVLTNFQLAGTLGDAGKTVVIEEFLRGTEVSCFVYASVRLDGYQYKMLPFAKDYKRIGEGDTGPNTGGMGAVSPVPFVNDELKERIHQQVVLPTLEGLYREGLFYEGFLFIGLMVVDGQPFVLEYNVRLGDPETQAILPRLDYDLLALFQASRQGELASFQAPIAPTASAAVVCASEGYPGDYPKGLPISGVDAVHEASVFHAGTVFQLGQLLTQGGRVLAVSAQADDLQTAVTRALQGAEAVQFRGRYYRRDIGRDVLESLS